MAINLSLNNLIYPYFIISGKNRKQGIKSFPEYYRFSLDRLIRDILEIRRLGINKILLFGIPDHKDALGTEAYKKGNIVSLAVRRIKAEFPQISVITDVCLCAYTNHGHCGIVNQDKNIIAHGPTLEALSRMALAHAEAGADWVAPSAMAKKQVLKIRKTLDENGYKNTKIMGYSAKFASNFYGPFRNAAQSSPRFGDRNAYQLDYADTRAAITEVAQDIKEGADMVMVKPALGYLDVIKQVKSRFRFPLAAYNVSGEYTFVKYGAKLGLWDEKKMVGEIMTSIKRAGADFIITYHAKDIARWLKEK